MNNTFRINKSQEDLFKKAKATVSIILVQNILSILLTPDCHAKILQRNFMKGRHKILTFKCPINILCISITNPSLTIDWNLYYKTFIVASYGYVTDGNFCGL